MRKFYQWFGELIDKYITKKYGWTVLTDCFPVYTLRKQYNTFEGRTYRRLSINILSNTDDKKQPDIFISCREEKTRTDVSGIALNDAAIFSGYMLPCLWLRTKFLVAEWKSRNR